HDDGSVDLLVLLEDGDERPADGQARAVQRMDEARLRLRFGPIANLRTPRLVITEVRAARDLAIEVLAREPHLEVVCLLRRGGEVTGAERDDAVVQLEAAQDLLGMASQELVLLGRRFGRRESDELHLVELVLPNETLDVLAMAAGFAPEARRVRRVRD